MKISCDFQEISAVPHRSKCAPFEKFVKFPNIVNFTEEIF